MSRIVYVNGEYVLEEEAKVSVFDRGFLFADGVYEVTSVLNGKLIDFAGHAARLERSLAELDMAAPVSMDELLEIHRTLMVRNDLTEGMIYLQVTRGADADRDFVFPDPEKVPSSLVLFTQSKAIADSPVAKAGIKVISIDDIRWGRRDIKTVQLLYPSMGKMMAKAAGKDDAWMVEDGMGHEDHRDARILLHPLQFVAHFKPQPRVQIGQRLVQKQHLGLHHQGPRQGQPLLLPAGHFGRLA